jgi:hypothetical protein
MLLHVGHCMVAGFPQLGVRHLDIVGKKYLNEHTVRM